MTLTSAREADIASCWQPSRFRPGVRSCCRRELIRHGSDIKAQTTRVRCSMKAHMKRGLRAAATCHRAQFRVESLELYSRTRVPAPAPACVVERRMPLIRDDACWDPWLLPGHHPMHRSLIRYGDG
eukprot:6976599-Prymnesium_polylepis.1